jgi:hypothetical protein
MRGLRKYKINSLTHIWTFGWSGNGQKSATLVYFAFFLLSGSGCVNLQDPVNRPSPLIHETLAIGNTQIQMIYSSPRVRTRVIWNGLVPYDKVWRTGANDATIFETNKDIMLDGKLLPKGKYSVFTIPKADKWTVIFNKDWDQWGAYGYDIGKDQLRILVIPNKQMEHKEEMTFNFVDEKLTFHWEKLGFSIPLEIIN